MSRSKITTKDGFTLDARRAVWVEQEGALIVADVHLGYAWVERQRGRLLPLSRPDDTVERLLALRRDYPAKAIVFLGDLVHGAPPVPALEKGLAELTGAFHDQCELMLVAGNHDRHLPGLIKKLGLRLAVVPRLELGSHLLLHGDDSCHAMFAQWRQTDSPRGRVLSGHEHPSIYLSDGRLASVRCPCFLLGAGRLVLPAFSAWAAGGRVQDYARSGFLAQGVEWERVAPIIGDKLLSVPWTEVFH
ncbi:MAG TPA: metallophosphoesterase [Verrucomicrobiae bacterium]|nr:metallophosphoesterase [Verrucomicrobiae bacterium]